MSQSIMLSALDGCTYIQPFSHGRLGDRVKLRDGEWAEPGGELITLLGNGRWEEISFPDGWSRHFAIDEKSDRPAIVFQDSLR